MAIRDIGGFQFPINSDINRISINKETSPLLHGDKVSSGQEQDNLGNIDSKLLKQSQLKNQNNKDKEIKENELIEDQEINSKENNIQIESSKESPKNISEVEQQDNIKWSQNNLNSIIEGIELNNEVKSEFENLQNQDLQWSQANMTTLAQGLNFNGKVNFEFIDKKSA